MSKPKTSKEKAEQIFKKNLTKAARTLVSLLNSKDKTVRMSATNFIIKKLTQQPIVIMVDGQKKKST